MPSLKSIGLTIGKAILLALGVPYVVAIVVHTSNGWPQSDKSYGRFSKQLWPPSRVLGLNYAVIQQMTLLKWLPLALHATYAHWEADPTFKDLPFGKDGLKMDIWPPKQVPQQQERPVLFFIYGGGWGSGSKEVYSTVGQNIADTLGAVVVIPDYRIYPKGNMADMVRDIIESIHQFRNLSQSLDLPVNSDKVILIGHSAGAHLSTMTAIQVTSNNLGIAVMDQTGESNDSTEFRGTQSETEGINAVDGGDANNEEGNGGEDRQPIPMDPEDGASRGVSKISDLAGAIRGVIGVSGVYHLMDFYRYDAMKGMEDIRPTWRAAEGLQNFEKYSPTCIVPELTEDQKRRLPPHLLVHGMDDSMAPQSSSSIYADVLVEAGVPTELKILDGGDHTDIFMDLMDPSRKWHDTMMGIIMEATETFSGEV